MERNLLIRGDTLAGLQFLLDERGLAGKVDLVYVDPPCVDSDAYTSPAGATAGISSAKRGKMTRDNNSARRDYVEYLRERIVLLRELLSDEGSLYLHCDSNIGHYLKVMMDDVFGVENFRNDIARIRSNPKSSTRIGYCNVKDTILFYTKTATAIWHEPQEEYSKEERERLFPKTDKEGRRYTTEPLHAPGESATAATFRTLLPPKGRHWCADIATLEAWDAAGLLEWSATGNPRKIIFADKKEGKRMKDIWTFKDPTNPTYPTEKNAALLDLIIRTSSNRDSIVLDCFCGSGTTLKAAAKRNRQWIGIDVSDVAISTVVKKMNIHRSTLFQQVEFIDLARQHSEEGLPQSNTTRLPQDSET